MSSSGWAVGVPVPVRVRGEGVALAGAEREVRAKVVVVAALCPADRRQHRERIGATVEEDAHQHGRGSALRSGHAGLKLLEPKPGRAVDRQGGRAGAQQERPARQPGAGRHRHPLLDPWQAPPGLRHGLAHHVGAGELVAVAGHQRSFRWRPISWPEGPESWRSASAGRSVAGRGRAALPLRGGGVLRRLGEGDQLTAVASVSDGSPQ